MTALTRGRHLGEDDVVTLTTLNNLGSLFWRQGKYAESLPFTAKAVDGRTRVLGADHPETLVSLHNLATTYDRLNRYTDAERTYLSTIAFKRRVLGDAHSSTVLSVRRLASMYVRQQRYDDAESQLLKAVGSLSDAGSSDSASDAVITQLIELYDAWPKPAEAAEWRSRSLKQSSTERVTR